MAKHQRSGLHVLESNLARMFGARAKRERVPVDPQNAPQYAAFRKHCATAAVTYKIARDGYIEFSDGCTFGHYGDWSETLERRIAWEATGNAG